MASTEDVGHAADALQRLNVNGNGAEALDAHSENSAQNSEDDEGSSRASERPANGHYGGEGVDKSRRVVAKFLMSNAAAGSIIGKGGANITDLQNRSSARLQLSRAHEFFPGTKDRVLICSGQVGQVVAALGFIFTAVDTELVHDPEEAAQGEEGSRLLLRFLLPSALCGVLIGRGGSTIRNYGEVSSARITVSSMEEQLPGVSDRVVKILGTSPQILQAVTMILSDLGENQHYQRLSTTPVYYGSNNNMLGAGWQGPFPPSPYQQPPMMHMGPPHPMPLAPPPGQTHLGSGETEQTIHVPEQRIGAVIGKGGEIITSMKNLMGVKIRISERDQFVPGTRSRKVTVSGPTEAVGLATQMIFQKISLANSMGPPGRQ